MSNSFQPYKLQHARPPLSFTISLSLLKGMSVESVLPSNHLILCRPLLLLPLVFPSIRVSSNEWALCIRWPKYWSFSFSISPSNGYSGLISFRIDWLDLSGVLHCRRILYQLSHKGSPLWCQGRLNIITKDTPIPPSFRKLQEFQEHCVRNLGQRSNIYFLLYDKCLL